MLINAYFAVYIWLVRDTIEVPDVWQALRKHNIKTLFEHSLCNGSIAKNVSNCMETC